MRELFYHSFLIFLLAATSVQAQEKIDSSGLKNPIQQGFRVGVDVSRLFMTATQKEFKGAEFSIDYNYGKLIGDVHLGWAQNDQRIRNYSPVSAGYFGSLGISKNLFSDPSNIFSLGGRIALSQYSYQATNVDLSEGQILNYPGINLPSSTCTAMWFEVVAAMRTQIWSWFMMGFEVRIKPRFHSKIGSEMPYYIPGYGLYKNNTSMGFNYYLYFNLPTAKGK